MLDLFEFGSFCLGSAVLFYLGSYHVNRKAEYFKSATRVNDFRGLSELLDNKTEPLLVAISGRIASNAPFTSKLSGVLGVFLEEKAKLVVEMRNMNGRLSSSAAEFLLQHKEVPWFLEDGTDRVHVVGARFAKGFYYNLKDFVFDVPATYLIKKFVKPQGFGAKLLEHTCFGRVLELGKPLTIVGEAVKYSNGALLIKTPISGPYVFFDGYSSLDKMISYLESNSQTLVFISAGLTAVATSAFALYVMPSVKKAWFLDKSDNVAGQKAKRRSSTAQWLRLRVSKLLGL